MTIRFPDTRHTNSVQRTKLSPPEQILFDAVRELNPHTEDEWAKVGAKVDIKWPRDVWRKVMSPCLPMG